MNCHTILFAHSFDEYFYLPKRRRMYWHFSLLPSVLPRSHESLMQSCHSRSSVIRLRVSLITMFDGWQQPWSTPWLIPTSPKQNTQNLYNQKNGSPTKGPHFLFIPKSNPSFAQCKKQFCRIFAQCIEHFSPKFAQCKKHFHPSIDSNDFTQT